MPANRFLYILRTAYIWLLAAGLAVSGCRSTRRVGAGEHLLRENKLKIKSDLSITRRGVLEDQLDMIVLQKTNTYWSGLFPLKLWRYNLRSDKYISDPTLELPKSMERPVIYDSLLQRRTVQNMHNFLYNQGYFNATVTDTVLYRKKKAYVTYNINTGVNYKVDKVLVDADDSTIAQIIREGLGSTLFVHETDYTKSLADEERSRLITQMQNRGYYKFSQDNISFELDTLNKSEFRDIENLFESAVNFVALQKQKKKKHSLDIKIIVRMGEDSNAYQQYRIGRIVVFPDFIDRSVAYDSSMTVRRIDSISYRYYDYYVKEQILHRQIFLHPGDLYSRRDHELTINKLNDLGIFQLVRIVLPEDTSRRNEHILNCFILLNPAKKLDAAVNTEVANATTYPLGSSVSFSYRDKNLFRGANQFTIAATGGVELGYSDTVGTKATDHFYLLSTNLGVNASILFPKFIVPFKPKMFNGRNLPKTQLTAGFNELNRINITDRQSLFRLSNISANFSYNWKESITKTWEFAPAFANIILPVISPTFQTTLDSNDFLKNTYRRTLIEGENLAFTFSDQIKKQGRNYNYLRISVEEAGLLLSAANGISKSYSNSNGFIYDQYVKFDLDARRYINARHSLLAFRFLSGIGNPYGSSRTLPYVKQYFVGGPYSLRGWRPRTLGPVSTLNTSNVFIDRTGDIKLEMNAEFRFDMIQLFSGTLNLNGALFADAGNTWLARKSDNYPGGDFDVSRLGHDIAMSTGAGLRVIVAGFFTVRLDAAFPIKDPYLRTSSGSNWVLNKVSLGDASWRRDNVVLQVAIGMPF